jgi:hypothetical protein
MVPTLRVRDPNAPLSEQEKAVFGPGARLHPTTRMPLEMGCTDHSVPGGGPPPSDDAQAAGHFGVMLDQLNKLCKQYHAETDYFKKGQLQLDHTVTAERVAKVAVDLADAGIIAKNWTIPQL